MKGSIFMTGGAGFLGRAVIAKAIREQWDASFTVYSRDETKQDELKRRFGDQVQLRCILGDVADAEALAHAMAGHPTVIHMAAVKYIPDAERNRWECVKVNVDGSRNVITAAHRAGVETCVGISTDKAVAPVNTYGYTKSLMEGLFAEAANRWRGTRFVTARYGNVVGSTGSVIPMFARQIREKRAVTITDPNMTRFWLRPDEAVNLIENAAEDAAAWPGAVFIKACAAMTIDALVTAVDMSSAIDGFDVGAGLPIERTIIGIRPGEKLNEDLLSAAETSRAYYWRDGYVLMDYDATGGWEPSANVSRPTDAYSSAAPSSWISALDMAEYIARWRGL